MNSTSFSPLRISVLIAILLAALSCGVENKSDSIDGRPNSVAVMVVGDSISAGYGINPEDGWVSILERKWRDQGFIRPDQSVVNLSVSGATTADGIIIAREEIADARPSVLIIELGGNDAMRKYDPDIMAKNLSELVKIGKAAGSKVILVGVDLPGLLSVIPTKKYKLAFQKVADDNDVFLVEDLLHNLSGDEIQADGIHPSQSGQQDMADTMEDAVASLLNG